MKKIILTSVIAMAVAMPAFADNDSYTNNQTYANSCNVDVFGGDGSSATPRSATAQWSTNSYNCAAGTYLPAGDDWTTEYTPYSDGDDPIQCAVCPANSFCYGSEEDGVYTYNASSAQGATTCESEWGSSYPYSDAGSDNADACYYVAPCPAISNGFCDPHATNCAYTNDAITTNGRIYAEGESGPNMPKCSVSFSTCSTGYTYSATQTAPAGLPSTATTPSSYQYRSHLYPNGGSNSNNDNDLSAGEWKITYSNGDEIKGIASCNSVPGTNDEWTWTNGSTAPTNTTLMSNSADATDASRRYCWCKMTGLTPSGGDETALSGAWVFNDDRGAADNCAYICALDCADRAVNNSVFRGALLGSVGASPQCVPNTITVNWGDGDNNPNNNPTTQCTYDGDLVTPTTAPTKRGHTFTGWTFPQQQ